MFRTLSYKLTNSFRSDKIHIYEGFNRACISGIRATIFGATGFVG